MPRIRDRLDVRQGLYQLNYCLGSKSLIFDSLSSQQVVSELIVMILDMTFKVTKHAKISGSRDDNMRVGKAKS